MLVFGSAAAFAADGAGKDDAVAMVKKAVTFIKEHGPEKAYPEFTNKAGKFIDRDLYVVVYQLAVGAVVSGRGRRVPLGAGASIGTCKRPHPHDVAGACQAVPSRRHRGQRKG